MKETLSVSLTLEESARWIEICLSEWCEDDLDTPDKIAKAVYAVKEDLEMLKKNLVNNVLSNIQEYEFQKIKNERDVCLMRLSKITKSIGTGLN
jgi:hypothetical protein